MSKSCCRGARASDRRRIPDEDGENGHNAAFHKERIAPLFKLHILWLLAIVAAPLFLFELAYLIMECTTCSGGSEAECDFQSQFAGSGPLRVSVFSGVELQMTLFGQDHLEPGSASQEKAVPQAGRLLGKEGQTGFCRTNNVSLEIKNAGETPARRSPALSDQENGETSVMVTTDRLMFPCGRLTLSAPVVPRELFFFSDFAAQANLTLSSLAAGEFAANLTQSGDLSYTTILDSEFANLTITGSAPAFLLNVSVRDGTFNASGQEVFYSRNMVARTLGIKSDGELFLDVSPPDGERLLSLTVEPYNPANYNRGHHVCIPHDALWNETLSLYNRWNVGKVALYFYNLSASPSEEEEKPSAYVISNLISCNISQTAPLVFSDIDCAYGSIKATVRPHARAYAAPAHGEPEVDLKNRGEISVIVWAGKKPQRCDGER